MYTTCVQQISITVPDKTHVLCVMREHNYCQIYCIVCNIPHKCKETDCVETLAKVNKMFYE